MNIHIESPCSENWNAMNAESQGRFCAKCQTIVVDFTDKTQDEIVDFIKNHSKSAVCGRFKDSQLSKSYNWKHKTPIWQPYRKAIALFIAAFLSLGSQSCTFVPVGYTQGESIVKSAHKSQSKFDNIKVSGEIVSKNKGIALPNSLVYVKELDLTILPNKSGYFSFDLPKNYTKDLTLKVICNHYETKEIKISKGAYDHFHKIDMIEDKNKIKMGKPMILD